MFLVFSLLSLHFRPARYLALFHPWQEPVRFLLELVPLSSALSNPQAAALSSIAALPASQIPNVISSLAGANALPSAIGSALNSVPASILPAAVSSLANAAPSALGVVSNLGGLLPGATSAVPNGVSALPGAGSALTNALSNPTGALNSLASSFPTGLAANSGVASSLASAAGALSSGLGPVAPGVSSLVGPVSSALSAVASAASGVPSGLGNALTSAISPANSALASGLNCGLCSSLSAAASPVTAAPTRTSSAATSNPSIIAQGTVYGNVYNYVFYSNTVVSVNGGFLDPRSGAVQGLLPGGQLVALLSNGLHIANKLVPYPPAYLVLLNALNIILPSLATLGNVIPA
ncbi:hypothetical protein K490DRAFT_64418 [Saccharata proteae CBS 121410]|uniref:Uncharacterized protein n=1 Tax=Saccharata proteae CBS 121410 TaxID=1314787 RepID=A0A6A5YBV7_9PEZI|nr:hypothetical protein K490DRAFT_64418 [Saccharata proteae CBS 121410]